MTPFIKLLRFPNLIIIVLSMILVQFTIIKPILALNFSDASIDMLIFSMITSSTVLIAAGGYVVNDIEDVKIDLVNHPAKVIVGKQIAVNTCWNLYYGLTVAGMGAGIFAGWQMRSTALMSLPPLEAAMLWFYSSTLKRKFLLGNLVVAILCALVLLKPMLYNIAAIKAEGIPYLVSGYAAFAFLLTLIREIIKDMEDIKGDSAFDCKTVPVVAGMVAAKSFVSLLIVTVVSALGWFQYNQTLSSSFKEVDYISFSYLCVFVQLPLVLLLITLWRSEDRTDFHRDSVISKLIMLTGLLSMPVFWLLL